MFTNRPAIKKENQNQASNGTTSNDGGAGPVSNENEAILRDLVQKRLLADTNGEVPIDDPVKLKQLIEKIFNEILVEKNLLLNREERVRLLESIISEITGYGPLEPLLNDPEITEIMVNGANDVYIERFGLIESTLVKFEDEAHLRRIIDRIVAPIGRRVDEASPMVDARLPNGFRVNATIPPLSLNGAVLTIRKFAVKAFTAEDLVNNQSMPPALATFLKACVEARINTVISGGTGTGKTTLLNVMSAFIPSNERIISIEDTAELQINQKHVIRLEKRPPNIEGRGEITIRQLVINALRMRPDRIIVGECRGGEALDMLQAMNTGHDGSMTTVHSNSPRDALRRIEVMVLMAGMDLPLKAVREQIASSIDLIIHLERMKDGSRKVVQVTEVQGLEGDTIVLQDIFIYSYTSLRDGRVIGSLKATGLRPKFISKLKAYGIDLPDSVFAKS
ncbi:MAG TPA: CpaF family protein [Anaerolineaceae bacterium]|nr:CpaF family protein [Anaerolineaceae bacterium]HQF46606.1 CpaF family protein [Anaerolineaceae bacterium]HQH36507.1 CpaF family protein [Anaerolineaceae bacterium]